MKESREKTRRERKRARGEPLRNKGRSAVFFKPDGGTYCFLGWKVGPFTVTPKDRTTRSGIGNLSGKLVFSLETCFD